MFNNKYYLSRASKYKSFVDDLPKDLQYEVGTLLSIYEVDPIEHEGVYELLVQTPDRSIEKFYIKNLNVEVGYKVRLKYNEEEGKYQLLGVL